MEKYHPLRAEHAAQPGRQRCPRKSSHLLPVDPRGPAAAEVLVDEGGRRIDTRRCHGSAAAVNLWQATNPKARDFRLDVIGDAYTSTTLTEDAPGVYVARVAETGRRVHRLLRRAGFRQRIQESAGSSRPRSALCPTSCRSNGKTRRRNTAARGGPESGIEMRDGGHGALGSVVIFVTERAEPIASP